MVLKHVCNVGKDKFKKSFLNSIFVILTDDGNFVLYDKNNVALWETRTYGDNFDSRGEFIFIQDDGQLSVRNRNEKSIWVSGKLMGC